MGRIACDPGGGLAPSSARLPGIAARAEGRGSRGSSDFGTVDGCCDAEVLLEGAVRVSRKRCAGAGGSLAVVVGGVVGHGGYDLGAVESEMGRVENCG